MRAISVLVGFDDTCDFTCDGTADEVEINASLVYLNALGGGTSLLLEGHYIPGATITYPGNSLGLVGVGRNTFIDVPDLAPTTFNGITITGRTDCFIKSLSIQTASGGGDAVYPIIIEDGSDRFLIEHVTIVNSDDAGIEVEGTNIVGGTIRKCMILDADNEAIQVSMDAGNTMDYLYITDTDVLSSGTQGIFVLRCRYSVVENCNVRNTAGAITSASLSVGTGSSWISFINNTVNTSACYGIWTMGDHMLVEGNLIQNCTSTGAYIYDSDYSIFEDNIIYNCLYGIYVSDVVQYGVISGNVIRTIQEWGIILWTDCHRNIITDNTITDCSRETDNTYDGIYMSDADRNLVCYNIITNPTAGNKIQYCINLQLGTSNWFYKNVLEDGVSGLFNDGGTNSILPEIFGEVTDPDGSIGTHPAVVLTDGFDVTVSFQISIKMAFQELVRCQVVIVPGGTGNFRRSADTNWGQLFAGEVYNQVTDSIAAGQVAVTTNELEAIDISGALTGLAVGDLVGVEFTREGSNALDTVNADCYFLGYRLQYV